jgi:hypothetical protein
MVNERMNRPARPAKGDQMERRTKRVAGILAGLILTSGAAAQGALVYSVDFDSVSGTSISGVSGGTATVLGGASVQTANPMGAGGGGFLRAPSNANQGATFTPTAAGNSLAVLSESVSGQRVLKGGFDFFVRSSTEVNSSTGSNFFRIIDRDNTSSGLRLIINNEDNRALVVNIFNSRSPSAGSVKVQVPSTFSFAANTTYHIGAIYENDGSLGNSTVHLFVGSGTGAIDTTVRNASNPAYIASATGSFDSLFSNGTADPAGLSSAAFDFGKLNTRSNSSTIDFDAFRLYDTAPTTFAAVPEPAALGVLGVVGALASRRRRR